MDVQKETEMRDGGWQLSSFLAVFQFLALGSALRRHISCVFPIIFIFCEKLAQYDLKPNEFVMKKLCFGRLISFSTAFRRRNLISLAEPSGSQVAWVLSWNSESWVE